jgi:hypothetical protein
VGRGKLTQEKNYTITFSQLPRENSQILELNLCDNLQRPFRNVDDLRIKSYAEKILGGENINIFFAKSASNEIITPELVHPVISRFSPVSTIIRDSSIVNFIQKFFNVTETAVPLKMLPEIDSCFIASDRFGLIPVTSLTSASQTFTFSQDFVSSLIQRFNFLLLEGSFQSLCTDKFTVETWLKNIELL